MISKNTQSVEVNVTAFVQNGNTKTIRKRTTQCMSYLTPILDIHAIKSQCPPIPPSLPPVSETLNSLSPLPATYSFNTDWLAAGEKIGMVDTFLLKLQFPSFKPFKTLKTFIN